MMGDPDESEKLLAELALHADHVKRVENDRGPEVVKAMNASLPFLEDYFLGAGRLAEVPYVPHNKQGNQRYTANSNDPEVLAALRRSALSNAKIEALYVRNLQEQQQARADYFFLAHKNIALAKARGNPPIPRFPPPRLARSMTQARLLDLAVKAASGLVDPSSIKVTPGTASLKKLRSFLVQFATKSDLVVLAAFEFEGLSIWSSAVGLTHPKNRTLPLLLFMDVSPTNEFAWPADMPTETRIACSLKVVAAFAAQIG